MSRYVASARFRVGVSPLAWTNDVLTDLGGDITLVTCLQQANIAGYAGVELGRLFPRDRESLSPLLSSHGLVLASGWYSGFLVERSVNEELAAVAAHAALLRDMGCSVMVYGECGGMLPGDALGAPMSMRRVLAPEDAPAYSQRLSTFAEELGEGWGLRLAYHHHLMMVAETFDEVSRMLERTSAAVSLLLDTGHAAAAGFDYAMLLRRFGERIGHIHLKDVRADVMQRVRAQDLSFNAGVRAGMFTVPGDGAIDFSLLARFVRESAYAGWLIVEAEQDPQKAPPLPTVQRARRYVASVFEQGIPG